MDLLSKHARLCAAVLAVCLATPGTHARSIATQPSAAAIGALTPGKYLWKASATGQQPVRIIISIADQRAYVYRGAALIAASSVSTGQPGNDTPTGEYQILQKKVKHTSNLYDNAAMPYMQRLTWDGVAIHAGPNPGYAASHGCVRVPLGFAKRLYAATKLGAPVTIVDIPLDPAAPDAMLPPPPSAVAARAARSPIDAIFAGP